MYSEQVIATHHLAHAYARRDPLTSASAAKKRKKKQRAMQYTHLASYYSKMAKTSTAGNEPKETRDQKRQRMQHEKEAKKVAKRFVFPLLVTVVALFIGFFIWRYGWSGMPKSSMMPFDMSNWEEQLAKFNPEMLEKLKKAAASGDYGDLLQDADGEGIQSDGTDIDLDEQDQNPSAGL